MNENKTYTVGQQIKISELATGSNGRSRRGETAEVIEFDRFDATLPVRARFKDGGNGWLRARDIANEAPVSVEKTEKTIAQTIFDTLGVKVGDTVKMVSSLAIGDYTNEKAVFGYNFNVRKDHSDKIGKTFVVTHIDRDRCAIGVADYYLPAFTFQKVIIKEVKISNEYTAKITATQMQIGCQRVKPEKLQEVVNAAREMGWKID